MNNPEEVYLIQKLKSGDIKALEVLFHKHYNNLSKYLMLLFKNQLLTEHIAQDIFVYIWENRESIEIHSSIESYLYTAGRYKALNQVRNSKRRESIGKSLAMDEQQVEASADHVVELKELENIIEEAISNLPLRCQQIFRLSRKEEMSHKEIAKILDISLSTVENQVGIALRKLRTTLRPFYIQLFSLA
jgi:RNA polymerase sigma-70 factor, ECF subfamily